LQIFLTNATLFSGIEVIYAKDPIGDINYRNAYIHGSNAWYIFKYLPKLVNE
jgi:hypothetical protein